jgi:hypothetical protein
MTVQINEILIIELSRPYAGKMETRTQVPEVNYGIVIVIMFKEGREVHEIISYFNFFDVCHDCHDHGVSSAITFPVRTYAHPQCFSGIPDPLRNMDVCGLW